MSTELDTIIKESIANAKQNVIKNMQKMIEKSYEEKVLNMLGIKSNWGNYSIVLGGKLDITLEEYITHNEDIAELMNAAQDVFKHTKPLTPTEVKHIKDDIRRSLRHVAIERVTNDTIDKLQSTVTEYAKAVLEEDTEIDMLINLDKMFEL